MSSVYEQQQTVDEILETSARNGANRVALRQRTVHEGVMKTVDDLLLLFAESGEFLTRIYKLPPLQQMILFEALYGAGDYKFDPKLISVRLKNISAEPVQYHIRTHHYRVRSMSGEMTDLAHGEKMYKTIAPGQEVNLPPDLAGRVLARYCKLAWDPIKQRQWPHQHDAIREVGYTFIHPATHEEVTAPCTFGPDGEVLPFKKAKK